MRGLLVGVWLTVIALVCFCYFSLRTIPQTDNQSIETEVPQAVVIEEQPPTPVESPVEDETVQVDSNDEDIGTSPGVNERYPFPDKWTEEFTPDVLSVDYRMGYRDGYNDGSRDGYFGNPQNQAGGPTPTPHGSSKNYRAGYSKGYAKAFAEWDAKRKMNK